MTHLPTRTVRTRQTTMFPTRRERADYTSTIATLKEAARAYVRAVIELLAKECPEGPSRVAVGRLEWIRTSPNTFVLHNREEPYWADGLFLHRDRLLSLGE